MAVLPLIPTQLVGSWCKPKWLCDHDAVYGPEGTWWKVSESDLAEAQDDAFHLAVCDQHSAGLTIVGDGEQRRQTFSGHFYSIEGIDSAEQAEVTDMSNDVGEYLTMKARPASTDARGADDAPPAPPKFTQPRVVSPLKWTGPILSGHGEALRSATSGLTKITIIGPTTLALRLVDQHYGSLKQVAFALADVLNQEAKALVAQGIDVIQFDEPEVHFRYSQVADFATEALDRAVAGLDAHTCVHVCYGYSKNIAEKRSTPVYKQAVELLAASKVDDISLEYEQPKHGPELLEHTGSKGVALGVLNLDTEAPAETPDHIAQSASDAISVIGPERLRLAPDCGMWFLPRSTATAKIAAMEQAAITLRAAHS